MDQRKLKLCHARELIARFLNLGGVEAWDLDKDAVAPHRADHRLAAAKIIDPLTDHFDCLIEHGARDLLFSRNQADEERSAALNIEAKLNFFLRRPDRDKAESDQQRHQYHRQQSLPRPEVGGKIPPEKNQ